MRVFHFVRASHGIENIREQRLKVATLSELNDPFELISMDFSNDDIRRSLHFVRANIDQSVGMICFSRDWHNPVQWSHYADCHRGICLGFDIPDSQLVRVTYSAKRLVADAERLAADQPLDHEMINRLLSTKYSHWRYENEVRRFVRLQDHSLVNGLYFAEFSDQLSLRQVIVGALSPITRAELRDALGDLESSVQAHKARLAGFPFLSGGTTKDAGALAVRDIRVTAPQWPQRSRSPPRAFIRDPAHQLSRAVYSVSFPMNEGVGPLR